MHNAKVSDYVGVLATIDPDAYTAATYTSDYVDAATARQYLAIVKVGTLGTNATVDAKIVQATDSGGTGKKDVSGKAMTQLTQAGSDDDKQVVITVKPGDLDLVNNFTHFAVEMTIATAACDADVTVLGVDPVDQPITDLASVDEIV